MTPLSGSTDAWLTLRRAAPGYACLSEVRPGEHGTALVVRHKGGPPRVLTVPIVLSSTRQGLSAREPRVLAVRIENGATISCFAFVITPDGVRRQAIDLYAALTLAAAGHHSVVVSEATSKVDVRRQSSREQAIAGDPELSPARSLPVEIGPKEATSA